MKPSEIIQLARRQTGCTEDIVTIPEAYRFLNFVIEDFGADIRSSDSGYGFDWLDFEVSPGQTEYQIDDGPGSWFQKFPISKLQKVWYRLPDGKWRDLPIHFVDKIDMNGFADEGEPRICFIVNNCIELIPAPKTSTVLQIWGFDYNWELGYMPAIDINGELCWRNTEFDLTGKTYNYAWVSDNSTLVYTNSLTPSANSTAYYYNSQTDTFTSAGTIFKYYDNGFDFEENIWIPKRWHYILVEGLKYWMYGNMGVNFETARANSRSFYDSEKYKALQNIVDRGQLADTPDDPDLDSFIYG